MLKTKTKSYADQRKPKRHSGNTFIRSNPNMTKEDANFSDFSKNQEKAYRKQSMWEMKLNLTLEQLQYLSDKFKCILKVEIIECNSWWKHKTDWPWFPTFLQWTTLEFPNLSSFADWLRGGGDGSLHSQMKRVCPLVPASCTSGDAHACLPGYFCNLVPKGSGPSRGPQPRGWGALNYIIPQHDRE